MRIARTPGPARRRVPRVMAAVALSAMLAPCPAARAEEPAAGVEARVNELQLEVQESFQKKDWERSRALIRRMLEVDPRHPKACLQIILLHQRRGTLPEARAEMDRFPLPPGPGRLYAEGVLGIMERRYDPAREALSRALQEYVTLGHRAGRAACHTAMGNLERRLGGIEQAAAQYESARALLVEIGDRIGHADVLSNLAKVERERGRLQASLALQREILSIRVALGEKDGQSRSLHEIGATLLETGDARGALDSLGQALDLRRRLQDRPAELATLRLLADAHEAAGDVGSAAARLREARALARSIPDARQEAQVLRQAGDLALRAGRAREALEPLEAAASLFSGAGEPGEAAAAKGRTGMALDRLGEHHRARAVLEEVLQSPAALADRALSAALLTQLGSVAISTGDLLAALQSQEQALLLHQELKNARGELTNRNNLGVIYHHLGDAARAERETQEALLLAQRLDDAQARARGLTNLGVLKAELGEAAAGREALEQAAALWEAAGDRRGLAAAWADVAEIDARDGDLKGARRRLDAALGLLEDPSQPSTRASLLNQRGGLLRLAGSWQEAVAAHREALAIADSSGLADEQWRAHWGLAASLQTAGRSSEGLTHGLAALERVERSRASLPTGTLRMRFLADKVGLHETLLELMVGGKGRGDPRRVAESLRIAERARARVLLDTMSESASRRAGVDPALRAAESAARDGLGAAIVELSGAPDAASAAGSRRRIEQAEEELRRVELRIRESLPAGASRVRLEPASVPEIQAVLGRDEALLEYFLGERRSWLWTVTRRKVEIRELPPAAGIRARAAALRAGLTRPGGAFDPREDVLDEAASLAAAVLPVAAVPPGGRLLIVPDGVLHHVPFETLPSGPEGGRLVRTHDVSMIPSAAMLVALRKARPSRSAAGFLGVGPPGEPGGLPLPFARLEIDRISKLFDEPDRVVLLDERATREMLAGSGIERRRYVHFATHGWIDDVDPRHSGLRLAGGPSGASLLSLPEIQGMSLSAELVVLSACESGMGELLQGEGVIGLTREFLRSGAAAVLVSLWEVGDESTADFMELFYGQIVRGRAAASALREAKLAFLGSDRPLRRSAFHWAPFVLVGDPDAGSAARPAAAAPAGGGS